MDSLRRDDPERPPCPPQRLPATDDARAQRPTLVATAVVAIGLAGLAPLATLVAGGDISAMELLGDPAELTGAP